MYNEVQCDFCCYLKEIEQMISFDKRMTDLYNKYDGKNHALLETFYDSKIVFIDPFVTISGLSELKNYYEKLYSQVKGIKFDFTDIYQFANKATASWEMTTSIIGLNNGQPFKLQGVSLFALNDSQLVIYHRDYFDAGEMIYEKIPIFGLLTKMIKKRIQHQHISDEAR